MAALCWSLLLKCMWWMSCWPWTNSAYVCVTACMLKLERVISSILLSKYTTYCRVGPDWTKREYVALIFAWSWHVLLLFDAVWGRNFTLTMCCLNTPQSHCYHVLSKYTIMSMMALLRWSSLVECMEWVSCLPCTNSAYVYIPVCVLWWWWGVNWKVLSIGDRCSMRL